MSSAPTAPGTLHVDLDALRSHARHLGEVERATGEASAAARHLDLHDGSFGLLCSFLPTALQAVARAAEDAVARSERLLAETVDGVLAMERSYRAVDDDAAAALRRLG